MREHDVALKLSQIGRLDAHAGQFAEAGVDAVDRLAAGENPLDRGGARDHAAVMGGVDGDRRAAPDRPPVGKRRLAGAENDGHSTPPDARVERIEAQPIDELSRTFDVPYREIGPFAGLEGSCLARKAERARRVAGGAGEAFVDGEPEQRRRHVEREQKRGQRRCAGIGVGGDRHRQAMLAHEVDRRRLALAQHIVGARKQDRGHAGLRHRSDALFVRIFEMIGRQRAELGRERRAARVRQLIGVQFDRKARPARGGEHAGDLVARERNPLAEPVDGVDQAFARQRRDHFVGDFGDIGGAVAGEFRRQRVGAEERRPDGDRALIGEPARDAERFALGGEFESVAGFDFDRPDAVGDQGVQPPQRGLDELVFGRCASRAHGRKDSAALAGDLFIGRARRA